MHAPLHCDVERTGSVRTGCISRKSAILKNFIQASVTEWSRPTEPDP